MNLQEKKILLRKNKQQDGLGDIKEKKDFPIR